VKPTQRDVFGAGIGFAAMAELRVRISTRNGKVRVIAAPGASFSVDGGVVISEEDGELDVRRAPDSSHIEVRCAPGTDVTIGTTSGNITCEGVLGAVRIATVSGKVRVEEVAKIDVRSKSGTVEIDRCADQCRVVVKSGNVRVGRAQRIAIAGVSSVVLAEQVEGAEIKTVSGKVLLGATGTGMLHIHTVSGKVEIRIPEGVRPSARLHSVSGRVENDLPAGGDGAIKVATVSGAIRVLSTR
jgi:DUF4097 and DUF4098 domain-containing protein YvlB